jgi:predicted GIY-YIG superfamily endonuclease
VKKYVYLISDSNTYNYKIGISNNPEKRIKELQTGNENKLKIIHKVLCENYKNVETALHNQYSFLEINGEWFELREEDVKNFPESCKKIDENFKIINLFKLYL